MDLCFLTSKDGSKIIWLFNLLEMRVSDEGYSGIAVSDEGYSGIAVSDEGYSGIAVSDEDYSGIASWGLT